jgi:hypothetical protein
MGKLKAGNLVYCVQSGMSHTDAKFDVRTVLLLKIQVSWGVQLYHWTSSSTDSHISENSDPQDTVTLNNLSSSPGKRGDGGNTFLPSTDTFLPHNMAHHIPEESSIINSSKITNPVQTHTAAVDCQVLPAT